MTAASLCRLLVVAFAVTRSTDAYADPVSLGIIGISGLFTTAFSIGTAVAAAAFTPLGMAALAVGASFAASALASKRGGRGFTQSNSSEVRYSTRQSAPAKRIVYGQAHCGGALFFERTSAPYLVQGFLIHSGEIESVDAIFIGTNRVSFAGGIVPGQILTPTSVEGQPDYAGHLRVSVRLGADDQTYDPLLRDRFGSEIIPDAYRQRGIATVVLEYRHPGNDFEEFQRLWGNGRQPSAYFLIKGKKVFDPRDPTQVRDVSSTWKYSNNATLCQTDYIRAEYGGRIAADRIDWEKVIEAADYDDSPMGTLDDGLIRKHTCDGMFVLNQPPSDVMGDLLTANRGAFVQDGGTVWPESSRPKRRVLTITDDMLAGGIQYQPFKNRRELVNVVEPRFVAEEKLYEVVPGPEWRDDALISEHGEEHHAALSLPFTLDHRRCQRLAKLFGLQAQLEASLGLQVDLVALARATGPLTGGVVTLQSALFPQANGDYEVKSVGFSEGFSALELACVEYDGSIESAYDPAVDEQPFEPETEI